MKAVSCYLLKYLFFGIWFFLELDFLYFFLGFNVASSLICIWILSTYKRDFPLLSIFLLDVSLPVVGLASLTIGHLFFIIMKPWYKTYFKDEQDLPFGEKLFSEYTENQNSMLSNSFEGFSKKELYRRLKLTPYIDCLNSNDKELKIAIIEKLNKLRSRDAVKLLEKAKFDNFYEVKYFANNALEEIEKIILEEIEVLSDEVEKSPTDVSNYNRRALLYLDIYDLGILDKETARFFLERSLYDYIFSLQLNPSQSYLYVKIVQIYLIFQNYENVISITNKALETSLDEDDKTKILFYRAEAYFYLKEYDKVVKDCNVVKQNKMGFSKIDDVANWWCRG